MVNSSTPEDDFVNGLSQQSSMSVVSILAESAIRYPDTIAIVTGNERTTYKELWNQTRATAGALAAYGVSPGIPVAMLIPNVSDFPRVYYAVLALGGVVVPINPLLKSEEIAFVLRDSGAQLLVCAAAFLEQAVPAARQASCTVVSLHSSVDMPESPARLEDELSKSNPINSYVPTLPGDASTILYTSGTSGRPKGAVGSHQALIMQVDVLLLNTLDMRHGDRILGCLPLSHTFGQTCTMNLAFRIGATVILMPRFDGDEALKLMVEYETQLFMGVPSMFVALLGAAKRNVARPPLRYAMSGGAAIPVAIIEAFRVEFAAHIHEGYGLTETSPVATFNHVGISPRPGTVGQAIWGVQVEVADPTRLDTVCLLQVGELGELVVRGHNIMMGYLNRPDETARVIVDGWFRTGDLGVIDDDGYVRVVDRTSDMIIRNGYNVYPREVEEVLARHPSVQQCAVFGVPHESHGEEIVAAVVLRPEMTMNPKAVRDFMYRQLAAYKVPRRIEIVESLPLGPSGKVLRRQLVAAFST